MHSLNAMLHSVYFHQRVSSAYLGAVKSPPAHLNHLYQNCNDQLHAAVATRKAQLSGLLGLQAVSHQALQAVCSAQHECYQRYKTQQTVI
jgi:hypothetical protein